VYQESLANEGRMKMTVNLFKITCVSIVAVAVSAGSIGCAAKLKKSPVASPPKAQPQVTLAALEEFDKEGIARQKVCPVSGEPLGSMGDPIKVLIDGKPLYLCCEGCVPKVMKDPAAYLSKVGAPPESR
jgi:hypothetical protein